MRMARRQLLGIGLACQALLIAGCDHGENLADTNKSEQIYGNTAMIEPVDRTPISSTPGAAPDNSQVEPRDPVAR